MNYKKILLLPLLLGLLQSSPLNAFTAKQKRIGVMEGSKIVSAFISTGIFIYGCKSVNSFIDLQLQKHFISNHPDATQEEIEKFISSYSRTKKITLFITTLLLANYIINFLYNIAEERLLSLGQPHLEEWFTQEAREYIEKMNSNPRDDDARSACFHLICCIIGPNQNRFNPSSPVYQTLLHELGLTLNSNDIQHDYLCKVSCVNRPFPSRQAGALLGLIATYLLEKERNLPNILLNSPLSLFFLLYELHKWSYNPF